ncbi:MAG: hypothetical protein FWG74_01295, partial [Planctomycetes bacterium]|nr:hypothetical protein [Planctomycetota bacterium]
MRKIALIVLFMAARSLAWSSDSFRLFLPDILPANTIACLVPPDSGSLEREYAGSLFHRLSELPEMAPFLRSVGESHRELAGDIARMANVPMSLATDLIESRLGLALIGVVVGRGGRPSPEFVVTLTLRSQPDRTALFAAVMALLNRPEVVRSVLDSQGLDPNLPLRTLAQEENLSGGYPPILRIGPDIRVASLGNSVIIYHGQGSDGIRKIFDVASNPGTSLSSNLAFQAVYRGTDASPGSSFSYVNVPRLISILDALNMSSITRITDAIGLSQVQALGLAGTYRQGGVRHNLYLHSPGGQVGGILSAIVPMPAESRVGMEGFAKAIPAGPDSFISIRVDMPTILRELPYFLAATGTFTRPGGMGGLAASEYILGVPLSSIMRAVGGDIVIRPHDDTQVIMFHNVDIPVFESVIATMEQNIGSRLNSLNIAGYTVRYFNRRSSISSLIVPAFCLVPRSPGSNRGILYTASHPQAVASLIHESISAREPLSNSPDFQSIESAMDS